MAVSLCITVVLIWALLNINKIQVTRFHSQNSNLSFAFPSPGLCRKQQSHVVGIFMEKA